MTDRTEGPASAPVSGEPTASSPVRPRLARSRSDRMIAGVAGGIARHLGVDPALVRLAFVLLAFVNGIGLIAYLVLWVVLPEEDGTDAVGVGTDTRDTRTLIGWGLVAVGVWMLLDRVVPGFGLIAFPLLLVVAGIAILVSATRR